MFVKFNEMKKGLFVIDRINLPIKLLNVVLRRRLVSCRTPDDQTSGYF